MMNVPLLAILLDCPGSGRDAVEGGHGVSLSFEGQGATALGV